MFIEKLKLSEFCRFQSFKETSHCNTRVLFRKELIKMQASAVIILSQKVHFIVFSVFIFFIALDSPKTMAIFSRK